MNTVQLECFMAVVEYLNFTRAADFLKITQPAVSHQITSLEDELGVKLFIRTSKKVSLTQAGLMFIEDASGILRIAEGARQKLGAAVEDTLTLHIGCHNQLELNLLPPILKRLKEHFPNLHPSVRMIPFKSMANLLEEERIHVMFGFREDEQKRPFGIFHELGKLHIACVCSAGNSWGEREALSVEELKGPMVICEPRRLPQAVFQSQSRVSAACRPDELYFADSFESMVAMVKAGLGFALLPAYPGCGRCDDRRGEELRYIPVSGIAPLTFGLYYKSLKGNAVLKEFIRLMGEAAAGSGRGESF